MGQIALVTDEIRENLQKAQADMEKFGHKNLKNKEIRPGDLVKMAREKRRVIKGKFDYPTTGPYRVLAQSEKSPTVVVLQMQGGQTKTINIAHLEKIRASSIGPVVM